MPASRFPIALDEDQATAAKRGEPPVNDDVALLDKPLPRIVKLDPVSPMHRRVLLAKRGRAERSVFLLVSIAADPQVPLGDEPHDAGDDAPLRELRPAPVDADP